MTCRPGPSTFEGGDAARQDFPADALQGRTIAVARDAAFCFLYAANIDCLQAMGAELVYFSPLADAARCRPATRCGCPAAIPNCMPQTLAANAAMKSQHHRATSRPASRSGPSAAA